jgi:pyrimidine deaminase RibD-like protein
MKEHNDRLLYDVIAVLADKWSDPKCGLVSCGLFSPKHPPVIKTSLQHEEGKWIHAERNAIDNFVLKYGPPGDDTIVIVTLSPCISTISSARVGSSCSDLLLGYGLRSVHIGAIDINEKIHGIHAYREIGFEASLSGDVKLRAVCNGLLTIFKEYGNRVNYEIAKIKNTVGRGVFDGLDLRK